ncbi:MAG: hypothetical protein Q9217_007073, partial [Psora testacea]
KVLDSVTDMEEKNIHFDITLFDRENIDSIFIIGAERTLNIFLRRRFDFRRKTPVVERGQSRTSYRGTVALQSAEDYSMD